MDYTKHFRVTKRQTYFCGCDREFYDIDDAILHCEYGDIEGFCEDGIRRNYIDNDPMKDEFECVCGKKGDWYEITENHHDLFKTTCMTEARRKKNSYCKSCNLQCASIKNYEIHCMTTKHRQTQSGIHILPLECDICKIKCKGQIEIRKHLETKKHKDMVASGKIADDKIPLSCDICKITCPSQKTMRTHLETRKHKKLASINNIRQSIST